MQVAKILKDIMERENLSYADVSRKLGMERRYVSTVLRKSNLKIETVEKICDACGYDLSVVATSRIDGFTFNLTD